MDDLNLVHSSEGIIGQVCWLKSSYCGGNGWGSQVIWVSNHVNRSLIPWNRALSKLNGAYP